MNQEWLAVLGTHLVRDISLDQDGSHCALMIDRSDTDWVLGTPAWQGLSLWFDLSFGIAVAYLDSSPTKPSLISETPIPLHYTDWMQVSHWFSTNAHWFKAAMGAGFMVFGGVIVYWAFSL